MTARPVTGDALTARQELVAAIRSVLADKPQWSACLLAQTGIDDGRPLKLQEIADNAPRYGFERTVTRERVRQVVEKARDALASTSQTLRWKNYRRSVADVLRVLPCSLGDFMVRFGYEDSADQDKMCRRLADITNLFGLEFDFRLLSLGTLGAVVVHERDSVSVTSLRGLDSLVGSTYGELPTTAMALDCSTRILSRVIRASERWEFLDSDDQVFWRRPVLPPRRYQNTGNKVLTVLCALFAAADRANSCDLEQSIIRQRSLRNRHIPARVIELIAQKSGLFVVADGEIRRSDTWSWCHVSDNDCILLDVCSRHGPVVSSDLLYRELIRGGISSPVARGLMVRSPFLTHSQPGVGFKRGIYKGVMAVGGKAERTQDRQTRSGVLRLRMTARAMVVGRLFCSERPGLDGTWQIRNGQIFLDGEITVAGHMVTGLSPIIRSLGLRNGDLLELRPTGHDGVLSVAG